MLSMRMVLVLLCVINCLKSERVRLNAKKLIKGKVIANGYSVSAKSLSQCVDHCNKRTETCDGVVYYDIIGKCRLINKCAPAFQVDNSTSSVYYSKRPQIKTPGYVHDPKSDTCLGLVGSKMDYASADKLCGKENAHLAVLNKKEINKIASQLLLNSRSNWTWINIDNIPNTGQSLRLHGLSGNDVLPEEIFTPQVIQWRNGSVNNCWGLNNQGQWGQFSCKNTTMAALCQVPQFKL